MVLFDVVNLLYKMWLPFFLMAPEQLHKKIVISNVSPAGHERYQIFNAFCVIKKN